MFSAKVPRAITHYKKFTGTERMMQDFYGSLKEGLKEKLACVLFQLPGRFAYDEEKLHAILEHTDKAFNNVIEFRNETWWRNDVQQLLKKHNISFCGVSYPHLPDEAMHTSKILYYRFHGVPDLFTSEYKKSFIKKMHKQIEDTDVKQAFVYFNNTGITSALNNSKYMKELVK